MRLAPLLIAGCLLAACGTEEATQVTAASATASASEAVAAAAQAAPPLPTAEEIAAERSLDGLIQLAVRLKEHSRATLPGLSEAEADALLVQHKKLLDQIVEKLNELDGELLDNYFEHLESAGTDADGTEIIDPDNGPFSPTLQQRQEAVAPAWLVYRYAGEAMGEIAPRADYFQALTGSHGSTASRDYAAIVAEHDKTMLTNDAAIAIPYPALVQRLIDWEQYLAKHPQSPWLAEALCSYHLHQSLLLQGVDNTPAFDYEDNKPVPQVAAAWRDLMQRAPDSPVSALLQKQLQGNPTPYEMDLAAEALRKQQRQQAGVAVPRHCEF
ncbi:hypothetical protein L1281_000340 [Neisseria sp. HSC-16F19]|nr:hypothetical protein [Neisseria sp. HSC-16F19]MCP2039770.1 hypothetical protein [Neisseria sp. HSC-16F19]